MANPPVLLILGPGPNVGASVARLFAAKGYRVATASRRPQAPDQGPTDLHIQADLSDPSTVPAIFTRVADTPGQPSVVVYNAVAHSPTPDDDPLSLPLAELEYSVKVNTPSAYAAAQSALAAFAKIKDSNPKTFIYTGNILNRHPISLYFSLGVGKTAFAHVVEVASRAYREKQWRFFYADERQENGGPVGGAIDSPAHAELFLRLVESRGQIKGDWDQTFVKGTGYKKFQSA